MSLKDVSVQDAINLRDDLKELVMVGKCRKRLKGFAIRHNLTDMEALKIARGII